MASGTSSLESNGSNESISHSYVGTEHRTSQLPSIPIPIDYEVVSSTQCFEQQNYAHTMSTPYESIQYSDNKTNENLKQQCEKALHDLNQLRRQHTETSRRCEHVMKELEYFRGQHRAAMNQLEVSAQEASSLRGKYGDLLNDNQRLEREVQHLQQSSNPETSSEALVHTLRKYEALKEELECFQKRYDDMIENHNTTLEKLRIVQEENSRLKTQCHELTQERNALMRERNSLKGQVAHAVRQWETGARERADMKRLADERNAAMAEYTLIMSERDTVHKEMEKLCDDLQAALKRVAALEAALQASREETRAAALQAESLRREIESALAERDRAIKECSDLKTPHNSAQLANSRQDNSAYHHLGLSSGMGTDGFLNGQHSNDPSIDKLQGLSAECEGGADTLEAANLELQRVRQHARRLARELADAAREAEVSKRRRDWAFSERDKLLQERESVKALCNRLRKERDQMVGELADARRQNKKQNENKEMKNARASMASDDDCRHSGDSCRHSGDSCRHSGDSCRHSLDSCRHSAQRDDTIDTDAQEFEYEVIDVELPGGGAEGSELGFELVGGREQPARRDDCGYTWPPCSAGPSPTDSSK